MNKKPISSPLSKLNVFVFAILFIGFDLGLGRAKVSIGK